MNKTCELLRYLDLLLLEYHKEEVTVCTNTEDTAQLLRRRYGNKVEVKVVKVDEVLERKGDLVGHLRDLGGKLYINDVCTFEIPGYGREKPRFYGKPFWGFYGSRRA